MTPAATSYSSIRHHEGTAPLLDRLHLASRSDGRSVVGVLAVGGLDGARNAIKNWIVHSWASKRSLQSRGPLGDRPQVICTGP